MRFKDFKEELKDNVTIIIGMKCQNGILVVCDSRTSEPLGIIHDDAQKLHVVNFNDGNAAIVAEAGHDALSSRAVEMIMSTAKTRNMDDYRALASCAEEAIADLKRQIRSQYAGTASELQQHFDAYSFELLIAHYYDRKPYIFTVEFTLGLCQRRNRLYVSIGCGSILADFIISPLDLSEFDTGHGIWTAVYAVEEIKRHDARCGGKTRSAILQCTADGLSNAQISAEEAMQEAVDEALRLSSTQKTQWIATATASIKEVVARRTKSEQTDESASGTVRS